MSAEQELLNELETDEHIIAVIFGDYGCGSYGEDDLPVDVRVPTDKRGVVLTWGDAAPLMRGWPISGGYGAERTYNFYAWTETRVFFVSCYNGSTSLCSVPRHPGACDPDMFGG